MSVSPPGASEPEVIHLSWQQGREVVASRLGVDPGPVRVVFAAAGEGPPLPEGTTLILERTSSGLWWASAEGPGVASWTADGAGLHLAQAIAPGSSLLIGDLNVLVWGAELKTDVPRTPRTPIGAPLDDEQSDQDEDAERGDAEREEAVATDVDRPVAQEVFSVVAADATDETDETGETGETGETDEEPKAAEPPSSEADRSPAPALHDASSADDRLIYNLTAPRDELFNSDAVALGGLEGRDDDDGQAPDTRPDLPAAPAPVSMPSHQVSPPSPPVAAQSARADVGEQQAPMRRGHATPATALPRAPGPNDLWVVHLEHREGATTREVTIAHPPSMETMLIVGRDPDAALQLTDPEVAPLQLGLQMLQGAVQVHPHPQTELALVVDGRQVDRPRPLREGAILTFGRHALRLVSSRIVSVDAMPPNARVARTVFQQASMELKWQLERPGRSPRSHVQRMLAALGQAPLMVASGDEPAHWIVPGLSGAERFELRGAAGGELIVRPLKGQMLLDGRGLATSARMRRGQVLEAGAARLMLIEAAFEPAQRLSWHPADGGPPAWVEAAPPPAVEGKKLVLDLRVKHPAGAEELVTVEAQAGWGAACVTIGREEDNDLILRVPTVSRTHAVLRFVGGGILLRDVSGRGSAWVNRRPVQTDTVVVIGDAITLGEARLDVVGVSFKGPERDLERRRVRVTVALQVSGAEGPELYRVDRVIWSDRAALLRVGAHPSSDITLPGAPISLGRFEVGQRGVVFVDGTGQGGRFYGGRSFERAVELVEGDAVEVGGVLMRFVGAKVVDLDS